MGTIKAKISQKITNENKPSKIFSASFKFFANAKKKTKSKRIFSFRQISWEESSFLSHFELHFAHETLFTTHFWIFKLERERAKRRKGSLEDSPRFKVTIELCQSYFNLDLIDVDGLFALTWKHVYNFLYIHYINVQVWISIIKVLLLFTYHERWQNMTTKRSYFRKIFKIFLIVHKFQIFNAELSCCACEPVAY